MMSLEHYFNQLSRFTPCGSQTLSKMANRYPSNYPRWLIKGKGAKVYDTTGREFIDLISGLGAIAVGYANDDINDAAFHQMQAGTIFSLPNPLEYEAAKRLTELIPGTEQWKFGKNGTDGTVMAVRAARALTGRTKIITVGYNGCADVFECQGVRNAGIPEILKEHNIRATYNDEVSFCSGEIPACILLEPMVFEHPKPGFLEWLRAQCTEHGIILIFDEVVNGGRFEGFVSSAYFGVKPDMYVLGKGLANGFPLCAVGGPRSIMQVFERDDFFASGTFGGELVSLAAFMATSSILVRSIDKMTNYGEAIKKAFNNSSLEAKCIGYPTRLDFRFPTSAHKYLFWQEMCKNGVLIGYSNFVKADNTPEEINEIISAMAKSLLVVKETWKNPKDRLIGPVPQEALKGRSN